MPARTGADYLERLRENPAEVYLAGEKVKDPTSHPALRNGAKDPGQPVRLAARPCGQT